jgi:hypothetical protein
MNKFLVVLLTLCFIGQSQSFNFKLKKGLNGDLHPKHRHLSEEGSLKLTIGGRGYFMYRLRVKTTESSGDASQNANSSYDGAYADETATDDGDAKNGDPAANTGAGVGAHVQLPEEVDIRSGDSLSQDEKYQDSDGAFSQTVYSRDGSMHINRYGYLVDDNGLLLVSDGRSSDPNAKHHIHIPSRAEGIVVTPTGKVLAEELGGSKYAPVGQLKLARFENPQGLNVRIKMKSNCVAADEDGFALGNWCAGSDLDGKDHTYMAETVVSGPGIVGKPGDQGFGRILI